MSVRPFPRESHDVSSPLVLPSLSSKLQDLGRWTAPFVPTHAHRPPQNRVRVHAEKTQDTCSTDSRDICLEFSKTEGRRRCEDHRWSPVTPRALPGPDYRRVPPSARTPRSDHSSRDSRDRKSRKGLGPDSSLQSRGDTPRREAALLGRR